MYTTDHIFLVLPIKDLINKDVEPTTPFKHVTGMKSSVSIIFKHVIFSICCTENYCTRCDKGVKYVSPSTKYFRGIFIGITEHQKEYLVYVPHTRKIKSSDDIFNDIFIVRWNICHIHIQKQWLCVRLCHTHLVLNIQK